MKRELACGTRRFFYTLTRKRVKRINARITRDGEIAVSAPPFVKVELIDAFVLENANKLLVAADKQKSAANSVHGVEDGVAVPILGEQYRLRILRGPHRSVTVDREGSEILLTLTDEDGRREAERALSAYLEREAVSLLSRLYDEVYSAYFSLLFDKPALRFRRMRGSFGNCRRERGIITLNLRLLYAPIPAIEYVILHEFVHMLHPDHSPRFWGTLARYMPDYDVRRASLRAAPIAFDRFL